LTEKPLKPIIKSVWGLSLRETIFASFFGVLVALSKWMIRLDIHIPGHTAIIWMSVLVIGCLWIRKGKAGMMIGFIAGSIAILLFPGNDGFLTFFKYFLPGSVLDLLFTCLPGFRKNAILTALSAMLSLLSKVLVDVVSGLILKIPFGALMVGLEISFLYHALFGFLSGWIAFIVYRRFIAKIPIR